MGKPITADQQEWAVKLNQAMGGSPQPIAASTSAGSGAPVTLQFPKRPGAPLTVPGVNIDPATMRKILEEGEKDKQNRIKLAELALEEARKWLIGVPFDELLKLTYPAIVAKIKEKFPAVHDLPKKKTLIDTVDKVLRENGYLMSKGLMTDPSKLVMEQIIAAYIAALPKNITAIVTPGGITLLMTGAADVAAGGAAGKKPDGFEFKNKDYTIQVSNAAWQALDPKLRAKWKSLNDEATLLDKLKATITSRKTDWESAKSDGTSTKKELELKIKDLEAEFKGRWDTLQESINVTAKASTDGIKATITEAKKKVADQKVGAELELKLEEMSLGLKTFASTPDLKTALTITGSAEKITAKVEAEALKTGTVVTLTYEKALSEVKEQLELQIKQGNTTVAATLSKEVVKLEEKLKEFKDSKNKDFEAIKGLESGLEKLQFEVKASFKAGNFKISPGAKVGSDGAVGGKLKVDLVLEEGIRFLGDGQKISFEAAVTNKSYSFALRFSVGEMPDLDDVSKANAEADEKIRKLYDMVKDTEIRNMDDADKIRTALTEVIKPLKKSVAAMKKADKKKLALELGLTVTGDFPSGGQMPPPVIGIGFKVVF